ncbi:13664_t:CDS:1, partial [Ambispora leptoticha]
MSALTCKLKYLTCQKEFETNCGFSQHNNTIHKLNKLSVEQKKIPVLIIVSIKGDIVYSIHRRLGKNSKNTGLQAVSLTCPESIFQVIFEGYIHCYNKQTGVSRCIFRGSTGYQELSNILNDANWGVKYYSQGQKTYVQLTPHVISQDQHPLIRCVKEAAAIATVKNSKT